MDEIADTSVVGTRFWRIVQIVLSVFVVLASLAWVMDLHRSVGMQIILEEFLLGMYGASLALTYLRYPARRGSRRIAVPWYDAVAAVLALACGLYGALNFQRLVAMISLVPVDALIVASIVLALTLEATRRSTGYTLVWMTVILFVYALVGHLVPGAMETRKVGAGQVAVYLGFDTNALPGQMMDIAFSVVVTFIVFGYLLGKSGGAAFFNDLAMATMGRFRGGPAKIAVVGSSLFGTISGVAAANAVAVGVVTIPMMKRSGVPATQAAAIEACASNGGQLMPPVMGAVAFVMADFLQVPYAEVALAALLPAILYYVALFVQADLESARHGYGRVEESQIPRLRTVLLHGCVFALPFAALIGAMFVYNRQPEEGAVWASGITILIGLFVGYRGQRMKPRDIWRTIVDTGFGCGEIIVICAISSFVLGLFLVSGLNSAFTSYFVDLGGSSLVLLLLMAAILSIILGLGLPTLAVYVMLAILMAPALVKVGIPPMAAHLFILYFGMMSLITPPIAVAAFVAATIAKAPPMATGWVAMRFGWSAYIVPFLFVFSPALLMKGSAGTILLVMAFTTVGIWAVSAAMVGYVFRVMRLPMRVAFVLAGILMLIPLEAVKWGLWANLAGLACILALGTIEYAGRRAAPRAAAA